MLIVGLRYTTQVIILSETGDTMKNTNKLKLKSNTTKVDVWDILVRIFHWSLVLFFSVAYLTEDDWLDIHTIAGYTVFLLLIFRLVWGVIGTKYAKFRNFLPQPKRAIQYLKDEISGDAKQYLGHNPAGAIMVYLLIIVLFLTTLSGMAIISTEGFGPLAGTFVSQWSGKTLEDIHELLTSLILFLVFLHIAGVVFSSFMQEENLVKAMITGKKQTENKGEK